MATCIICKKKFVLMQSNYKCCSNECSLTNKKNYERSEFRRNKHMKWRQSKHGEDWIMKYNKSERGMLLKNLWRKTKKAKELQKKYDAQDKRKLARKLYRQTEKGKEVFRMIVRKREERKNNCIREFSIDEWKNKLKNVNGICESCDKYVGENFLTMDHIYPLSVANEDYIKTGIKRVYKIDDVTPLCRACNSSKSNKIFGVL